MKPGPSPWLPSLFEAVRTSEGDGFVVSIDNTIVGDDQDEVFPVGVQVEFGRDDLRWFPLTDVEPVRDASSQNRPDA